LHLPEKSVPVRAILFDKDGTLFDFRGTWLPIMRAVLEEIVGKDPARLDQFMCAAGYDPATDRFRPDGPIAAGNALDIAAAWKEHLPEPSGDTLKAKLDEISLRYGPYYALPVCDLPVLMDSLLETGLVLGLATSDSEEAARTTLKRFDLQGRFSSISGYDSGGGVKPDPVVVETFARSVGVAVSEVVVVGDTWHDLRMARDAGAAAGVGVCTGAVEAAILEPEADLVLPNIASLPRFLEPGNEN
jgi:phosphoglycolate phosphatase